VSTESILSRIPPRLRVLGGFLCLYLFFVGVSGIGEAFKMFGQDLADRVAFDSRMRLGILHRHR
jgi:hypothetical protein